MYKKLLFISILILIVNACENRRWYSIEQKTAEPFALLKDGIYASGDYVRSARVIKVNDKLIDKQNDKPFKIGVGTHKIMIYCNEASGEYDSSQQDTEKHGPVNTAKKARILTLEADTERVYRVNCVPYTHWWITDTETGGLAAGAKPDE